MENIRYDYDTYEDFLSLQSDDTKVEYDNGYVFYMSPVKPNHNRVKTFISNRFVNKLGFNNKCEVFTSDVSVLFSNDIEIYEFLPDILISCDNAFNGSKYIGTPSLIVEILSYATKDRDIGIKLLTYEKFGVEEYWIVDIDLKEITLYRDNRNGKFHLCKIYSIDDTITSFDEDFVIKDIFDVLRW